MDDLLREFLTETNESLDRVDAELVRFEQEPNNGEILGNIFRLVHSIKGTCGFLSLPRLEALAHAAEGLMAQFRDGLPVTSEAVTLILSTIDRIKSILDAIETSDREPPGDDLDLIGALNRTGAAQRMMPLSPADAAPERPSATVHGETAAARPAEQVSRGEKSPREKPTAERLEDERGDRLANHSIRVHVETLDHLMNTVSELVLTPISSWKSSAAMRIPTSRCRCSVCRTSPPSCRKG